MGQDLTKHKYVVLNADDPWSEKYAKLTPYPVYTYALKNNAHFTAENCNYDDGITTFDMNTPEGKFPVTMKLLGEFNVYNVFACGGCILWARIPIRSDY
ncbi:UDP-N-acetylmuramyl-tripeptide synthetase OS=Ureibacillus acetophenoni OX=614649 GN=murE PE=3 SV=1 [Ureibacillus acetophenoni]